MRITEGITFVLAHLSLIACIFLARLTSRRSKKIRTRTRLAFLATILIMFVWNLGTLLEMYHRAVFGSTNMVYVAVCYFGICFIPIALLWLGASVSRPYMALRPLHLLFLVIPCVSMVMVCTNNSHRLFFATFSIYSKEAVYGAYYYFHSAYSYGCILAGIALLIVSAARSSGIFSGQSLLIALGILPPLLANVLYSFALLDLTFSINACMFTVSILCFTVAFHKYGFLQAVPIAVHQIVNLISDGYLVIDRRCNIVDHNKAMLRLLPDGSSIPRNMSLEAFLGRYTPAHSYREFRALHRVAVEEQRTMAAEYYFSREEYSRYFDLEVTPVFRHRQLIGSILLLKDITQAKRDLATIKETQSVMIERERLASLGQMVGGIAHNLKTPILSIAGGLEALGDLVAEYRDSAGNRDITAEDHREIAAEMGQWLEKIRTHCSYISDMITTVKGQAVQFNPAEGSRFTLDEFLKRVDLLMKHELKKYHCVLRTDIGVDPLTEVKGDVNSLVQIFDNLIINAIHAYDGRNGDIDLSIREEGGRLLLTLRDYGKGIDESVRDRLFKEMVTTKGKNGTGLGLYLSYSTIKGHFGGQMELWSRPGQGAAFTISLPSCRRGAAGGVNRHTNRVAKGEQHENQQNRPPVQVQNSGC